MTPLEQKIIIALSACPQPQNIEQLARAAEATQARTLRAVLRMQSSGKIIPTAPVPLSGKRGKRSCFYRIERIKHTAKTGKAVPRPLSHSTR